MIIVAGHLRVDPQDRDAYLAGCESVVVAARTSKGCLDFTISADPIEDDRINVYEAWESVDAVEAFRGDGPESGQENMIVGADVSQYEIASVTSLT